MMVIKAKCDAVDVMNFSVKWPGKYLIILKQDVIKYPADISLWLSRSLSIQARGFIFYFENNFRIINNEYEKINLIVYMYV